VSRLALYLLGSPEVQLNDNAVVVKERKALALLIYLGVTGAPHRRETLATLLWPEYSYKKGRTNLRRVLYVLRQAIGDDWLKIEGESVSLSPAADFWIDIGEFTELASQYPGHLELDQSDLDSLERAVSLYRGDFLAGFAIADSPAFDEWQFFESETARQSLLTVLDDLIAEYSHRSDYEAALGHARRRLVLDPLHEPAQQNMMRLYALCGQQAAALRQYDLCMQIFEKELGLPPSEETTNLFEQIRAGTVRRDELLASTDAELEPVVSKSSSDRPHIDRHEAPDVPDFFGRESELAQLETWVVEERCRLIVVLGMGGLGKTTLTAKLTHHLVDELTSDAFDQVLWRSLLNAPRLSDLLPEILQFLSRQQLNDIPSDLDQRFDLLLAYLREQRCLLILDNAESLLQEGAEAGAYRPDYEDYGQLFMRVAQHTHQSCLLVTSREAPLALRRLAQESHHVQLLNLGALSTAAGQRLLLQRGLTEGSAPLIDRYSGNPLALKLVADTIEELFFGDVDSFLTDETLIFDDIRTVLAQQMDRLTPLEEEILLWLAIERGPVTPSDLWENLLQPESRRVYIEALGGLQRRSLLEKGDGGFALQNVITEFLTERLVDQFCTAIEEIRPEGINHHALIKAQAKEHVRQSQVRLILKPIAERLLTRFDRSELETNLATIRENIRSSTTPTEGYAGGNILNLLLQADGDLTGADFSKMAIWQAYLRGVNLQDVDFREADLSGSLFTDTFGQISSVDISPDGLLVAAGGSDGRIWVWRLADGQLQLTCEGHTDCIWSVCFSPDGRLIASGSRDRTVRIWSASTGEELAVLRGHTGMIWSVAFSPDGKTLASGAQTDNTLKRWDVAEAISLGSSQLRETLRGHSDTIRVVRFSPDGRLLASGCQDHSIRLWRADGGQELARLDGHSAGVWAVAFSPDGTRLASGGEDDLIHLWNIAKTAVGREVRILETLHGHEGWVRGLSFSPDGSILASAAEDRTIRIWDVPSSQLLNVLHGH
jgi:DNA-binding SARP family transcriptional activator